jgi:hypothetical protein
MEDCTKRDTYDIEKQIYKTQWTNIRQHWALTLAGTTLLTTLIALAIVPIRLIYSNQVQAVGFNDVPIAPHVKYFVAFLISIMGIVTFLNQYNHYRRSQEARKVVVEIEKSWGLYDEHGRFIYQPEATSYAYAKFAGGEKRLTYSVVQFCYVITITLAGLVYILIF